ncbi:MAG TPA: DsbA family protein [Sphingomonas sp.]|nr:DsbA family protein [Sphingomonas sp.]
MAMKHGTLVLVAVVSALIGAGAMWGSERLASRGTPVSYAQARGYVLDHPEMLRGLIDTARERYTGEVIAANRKAIIDPYAGAWAGNPKGDLTIVEYFDYNCGYCRATLPTIARLLASDPKLRIVYREWPILSPESGDAAKLSLLAAEQNKFMAFHTALYDGGQVTPASMAAAAKRAGVDTSKLSGSTARADAELDRNMKIARDLGASGTPTWVIGNKVISAAMPFEAMQQAIAEARAGH